MKRKSGPGGIRGRFRVVAHGPSNRDEGSDPPDGSADINELLFFLFDYEAGC